MRSRVYFIVYKYLNFSKYQGIASKFALKSEKYYFIQILNKLLTQRLFKDSVKISHQTVQYNGKY